MNEEKNNSLVQSEQKKPYWKGFIREILEIAFLVIFVLLPIRFFVVQPFVVVGTSMYPTFSNGDYLIIDEISYRFEKPQRGDVIVLRPPVDLSEHYIKRIVGLPGETITVVGNKVTIVNKEHPQGFVLSEPYVSSERDGTTSMTLGPNQYFVMGDNREVSSDSRVWGEEDGSEITGKVMLRLFPLNEISLWPGEYKFSE